MGISVINMLMFITCLSVRRSWVTDHSMYATWCGALSVCP